jgi:hypothetical protein
MIRLATSLVGLLLLLSPAAAPAHELRPAYLEMRELAGDRFAVLWKVPALGDRQLGLYVNLPAVCSGTAPAQTRLEGAAATARWTVACAGSLEAVIALSIVFLTTELAKKGPDEARLSARVPWLVAFAFGLLHGFGFAGALREVGLPQQDVPLALLTFNLGVEAGQLLFVGAAIVVLASLKAIATWPAAPVRRVAAYAIGTISAFWLVERLAGFV